MIGMMGMGRRQEWVEWGGVSVQRRLKGGHGRGFGQESGVRGLRVGIRVLAVASLGQGAAASATGRWAAGGWPACLPSAAAQRPRPLPLRPPSRWPRSCPACHSPAQSAPPEPSEVGRGGRRDREWGKEVM